MKLAEDQEKRKLELHEKSFLYQKQRIENKALIAKEKVALVNFDQNLSNTSQSNSSKSSTNSIEIPVRRFSLSRLNHIYRQNNLAPMCKVENAEHFKEPNLIRNVSFSPKLAKFDFSDYCEQLRKRESACKIY